MMGGMERNELVCYLRGWEAGRLWSSLRSRLDGLRSRDAPRSKVLDGAMGVRG